MRYDTSHTVSPLVQDLPVWFLTCYKFGEFELVAVRVFVPLGQPHSSLYWLGNKVTRVMCKFCEALLKNLHLNPCHYTPRNEVRGGYTGITMSVRLSVRPSVRPSICPAAFGFPAHNCFPFTPIIMTLHMQAPHESRMCPIDFEVKRSKVKVTMHKLLKMVSGA